MGPSLILQAVHEPELYQLVRRGLVVLHPLFQAVPLRVVHFAHWQSCSDNDNDYQPSFIDKKDFFIDLLKVT